MPKNISDNAPDCFISIIEHSNFKQCLQQLRELVQMKTSTRIVLVTGPTGAGKTTAREQFAKELEALAADEIKENPEMVAYGACSVKAPGPTAFSWKDTYLQLLLSLHHPFVDAKLGRAPKELKTDAGANVRKMTPDTAHRQSNDRLFRVLQRTISHRRPKALIFDEAHHLLRVSSSQTLVNQLEHIKYIADETQTLFILFGTYELIELMDLSSALIRRREIVHFPRYTYDSKDPAKSLKAFADVVAVFARDLDEMSEQSLLLQVPYLYQGSVGCVGVLRDWLFRAYSRAKTTKRAIITKAILEKTILSPGDRLELIKDVKNGEEYFRKRLLHETNYLIELGFIPPEGKSDEELETPSGKRPKKKPFQRNPHNDPVGTAHLDPGHQTHE
jgi:energy-coupling factor transporter ATP-binding protein EcfA2